jgi:hypothetical protein
LKAIESKTIKEEVKYFYQRKISNNIDLMIAPVVDENKYYLDVLSKMFDMYLEDFVFSQFYYKAYGITSNKGYYMWSKRYWNMAKKTIDLIIPLQKQIKYHFPLNNREIRIDSFDNIFDVVDIFSAHYPEKVIENDYKELIKQYDEILQEVTIQDVIFVPEKAFNYLDKIFYEISKLEFKSDRGLLRKSLFLFAKLIFSFLLIFCLLIAALKDEKYANNVTIFTIILSFISIIETINQMFM